jgi:GEVED domain/Secretion system C-terminal sorting domain
MGMKIKKTGLLFLFCMLYLTGFGQYCITGLGGNCNSRPIANVSMSNMQNIANGCTGASGANYANFTANPSLQINVIAGQNYFLKVKVGGALTAKIAAWVDWDQDSIWSTASEFYNICTSACQEDSVLITIPNVVATGAYRMRIRSKSGTVGNFNVGNACTSFASGETEDYTIFVTVPPPLPLTYCISEAIDSADDDIGIFSLGTFVNASIPDAATNPLNNPLSTARYTDFTTLPPIQLFAGLSNTISITQVNQNGHYPCYAKVWIDYNHDTLFDDATETLFLSAQSQDPSAVTNGNVLSGTINIPSYLVGTIDTGVARLRIVLSEDPSFIIIPCGPYNFGETEDYLVHIQIPLPCTGTPTAGTAVISNDTVCAGETITLSLTGTAPVSGLNYQWQSSSSLSGIYTNLSGANFDVFTLAADSVPEYFRCQVTCTNSGLSSISNVINYYVQPNYLCTCSSAAGFNFDEDIGNVQIGTLNNGVGSPALNNTLSTNTYSNFTNLPATTLLSPLTLPIQITQINASSFLYDCGAKVWIDFNQDGQYQDSIELVYTSARTQDPSVVVNGNILNGQITIPNINGTSIKSGITSMRIVLSSDFTSNIFACGTYTTGETEDYLVNILAATACIGTPVAGNCVANDSVVCIGEVINFSLNGSSSASGLSYQWKKNGLNILGATNALLSDTILGVGSYQCLVTCTASGLSTLSSVVNILLNPFTTCYCSITSSNTSGSDIGSVTIGNFTNGNPLPILGNSNANNAYTDFTSLPAISITKGVPNFIKVTGITLGGNAVFNNLYSKVFIDYNHDGQFDTLNELVASGIGNYNAAQGIVINSYPIISSTALTGNTRMRVMLYESLIMSACQAAGFAQGETEDYLVNIQNAAPCSGQPFAGNAVAIDSSICAGSQFSLSLANVSNTSGLTYQWQANGINILGANTIVYSDTMLTSAIYQCVVTCSNSGQNATSSSVSITFNGYLDCYCKIYPAAPYGTDIGNVTVDSFSNGLATPITGNTNATNSYTDFTNLPPIQIAAGVSSYFKISGITVVTFANSINLAGRIFIDFNQDGTFDPITELVLSGTGNYATPNGSQISTNYTIPSTAFPGLARMRVMLYESNITSPCATPPFGYGETEDYLVSIQAANPCSGIPIGGFALSSDSAVCSNTPFNLSLTGNGSSSNLSYQWYANNVLLPNDTLDFVLNLTQSTTTTYYCAITCNNSGSTANSNPITVNMDIPANCICIPHFSNTCNGDEIISVSINGIINNSGTSCPIAPYHTVFNTPIFTAKPGDTTECLFKHGLTYKHYINMWIDYNDDFDFADSERVITNLRMSLGQADTNTDIIAKADTGLHKLRVVQNYNTAYVNPQPCGNYNYGETEDYFIYVSNTVTTLLQNNDMNSKNLKVYPNPSNGIFYIKVPETIKDYNIKVTDLLGRIILDSTNKTKIDLSTLNNGNYTVTVSSDKKLLQSKIVLNK